MLHIVKLSPSMKDERKAVAAMHVEELPDSALARLGPEALYETYYGVLLEHSDYFCYVAKVDGAVAGFAAFSSDLGGTSRYLVKRAWPRLSGIFLRRVFKEPAFAGSLWKMAGSFLSMKREPYAEVRAEAMSTAVAARYRSLEFFQRTGLQVSRTLYLTIARVLHAKGAAAVKGFTRKSNVLVNASLGSLGWKKVHEGYGVRGAEKEPACIWTWDLEAAVKRWNLTLEAIDIQ